MERRPIDYKASDINDYEKAEVYLQYAAVYKDAIEILLKDFSNHHPPHDYALAPLLALLRHFIEIQLKGIIMHGEELPIIGRYLYLVLIKILILSLEKF